jgi:hypothetical protein
VAPTPEAARAARRCAPLPATGRPLDDLLADVADLVLPHPMGKGRPN